MSTQMETEGRRHRDLLELITDSAVDEDYARRAAERGDEPPGPRDRRRGLVTATIVLAVLGLLVSIALVQRRATAPVEAAERAELIEQIGETRTDVETANDEVERLRDDIAAIVGDQQDVSGRGEDLLEQVERARILVGKGPVTGPGMRITVDDARDGIEGGTVLDDDLQVLANGLWQAGAEAVAVNGNRIGPLTAIRTAGQAINVNYRPLSRPYVVTAIGDPDTLPARFNETLAGQSWADLETNYGIRFDIEEDSSLVLPGVPAARLRLRNVEQEEEPS